MVKPLAVFLLLVTMAFAWPNVAQAASYCPPGQPPRFQGGFAFLKSLLGATMGEPLECEHSNPENGDALLQTTTGLSFYRKATNTPTFTDGFRHWAWTVKGLVYWEGQSIDPPGTTLPVPVVKDDPITDAFLASGSDCDWNWFAGPSSRVTSFPAQLPDQYCLVINVSYWPKGWHYQSRWTYSNGFFESTDGHIPCAEIDCVGGWIRDTWTNPYLVTEPAGAGTVELLVNGVLVRTLNFTIAASTNNRPVAILDNPATDVTAVTGTTIQLSGRGQDSDGSITEYRWGWGSEGAWNHISSSASAAVSNIPVGTWTLLFQVKDDLGAWSDPVYRTVTVIAPPQDLISSTGIAIGDQCLTGWATGVQWAGEFPGDPLPATYCYVVVLNWWPKGWSVASRWTWPDGAVHQTAAYVPCPANDCTGGYQKYSWNNPNRYSSAAGTVTIELIVNGAVMRTDRFLVTRTVAPPTDIQAALAVLRTTSLGAQLADSARGQSVTIVFGALPADVHGRYQSGPHTITLALHLQAESSAAVAAVLGHELWHANYTYPNTYDGCLQNEIGAFSAEASIWSQIRPAFPRTLFEEQQDYIYSLWLDGSIPAWVAASPAYQQQCSLAA